MTMSQQDKERLLQALQDDPEFLAQVRNLVLSAELVQLPELFAQFAAHVTAFIQRQEQFNADFRGFIQRQEEFNADFRGFIQRQEDFNARQEAINARVEERLQRITDDLGVLKGHAAGRMAREMSDDIAEHLGYEITQQLNGNDLRAMLRGSTAYDIPSSVRRSFYVADLVAKVQDSGRQSTVHGCRGILHRRRARYPAGGPERRTYQPFHGHDRRACGRQPRE